MIYHFLSIARCGIHRLHSRTVFARNRFYQTAVNQAGDIFRNDHVQRLVVVRLKVHKRLAAGILRLLRSVLRRLHGKQLKKRRHMDYRVLKSSVGEINLPDLPRRKGSKQPLAQRHCVHIGRLLDDGGILLHDLITGSVQGIPALFADRVDPQVFLLKIALCDQLHNVGIVAARKSPVRGYHDHSFLLRFPRRQVGMV